MEENNQNAFLGEGKIGKLLFKFAIPCVTSLLISALYNIIDQIFIGHSELGFVGNAATGVVFPVMVATSAFAWCFGDGSAAYLNICQGKKETGHASKAIGTSITMTFIISVIMMILCLTLSKPMLYFFAATESTIDLANEYLIIVASFFPIYMLQNMMNGVVRSDGSPLYSMLSMVSGAVVNIALDALFIFGLKMGIAGAAWATVIGESVSFLLLLFYYFKRTKTFKVGLKELIPDMKEFWPVVKLGISTFITQLSVVAVSIVINNVAKQYGETSIYGTEIPLSIMAVETKIFNVVINIVVGIVLGGQPIIGYNIGARNYDRVKQTYLLVLYWVLGITVGLTLLFELAPEAVLSIFGGTEDPLYVEYGVRVIRVFLGTIILTAFIKMSAIFFQAMDKPIQSSIVSLSRDLCTFIPAILIIPMITEKNDPGSGINTMLYSTILADSISAIIAAVFTVFIFKRLGEEKEALNAPVQE